MSSKSAKVVSNTAASVAVGSTRVIVSHMEAARRIAEAAASATTRESAQALLRKAGILNSKNKLVKGLS